MFTLFKERPVTIQTYDFFNENRDFYFKLHNRFFFNVYVVTCLEYDIQALQTMVIHKTKIHI